MEKMKLFIKKNKNYIVGALIIVFLSVTFYISYGFFENHIGQGSETNIFLGTATSDKFIFENGNAISIGINATNFEQGDGNISSSNVAKAKLKKGSTTDGTLNKSYNVFIRISSNNFIYTTLSQTPEILLSITDPDGNAITSINGLTYTTVGEVSGFDITTKTGVFTVATNKAISSNSTSSFTEQNWSSTITMINLDTNQDVDFDEELISDIVLTKDDVVLSLPSEYQQVEYIESSGTQYINTNYISNQNTKIETSFSIPVDTTNTVYALFGYLNGTNPYNRYQFQFNNSNIWFSKGSSESQQSVSLVKNTWYNLSNNGTTWTLNDNSYTAGDSDFTKESTLPLYIFGRNYSNKRLNYVKVAYFKIYENNTVVRNLISCYRKSDNVIGMYDTVNGLFYVNQGTGVFTKGNNVE